MKDYTKEQISKNLYMAIYRKIKTKQQEEGKSSSPALLHGKITT
jgi:hypothetical protein